MMHNGIAIIITTLVTHIVKLQLISQSALIPSHTFYVHQ